MNPKPQTPDIVSLIEIFESAVRADEMSDSFLLLSDKTAARLQYLAASTALFTAIRDLQAQKQ